MPIDNSTQIPIGGDIEFPSDGPIFGTDIIRLSLTQFNIVTPGIY
jgi:hypothetical protein